VRSPNAPSNGVIGDQDLQNYKMANAFLKEPLAKVISSVIPVQAGIQNFLKILDSGSRFAVPE